MMTLAIFVGIWTSTCIQTQISGNNQGFVKETYSIEKTGEFEFTREWFQDSGCSSPNGTDTETGTITLGKKLSGMFITGDTYEADFSTQGGTDLGAMTLQNNTLKMARGMKNSSMRNTMVGIFGYVKRN
jgi:hypothetical protein